MLVGYTGFVGSNLCLSHSFASLINSKNIASAYGACPETLIYSGVPAEMFIANQYPEKDKAIIENAKHNIEKIRPGRIVLISTVAVYDRTDGVDEDDEPEEERLTPYGRHRLDLEHWVETHYDRHLIVRLPAIYGENLKKNFIYDFIHYIPPMLTKEKYLAFAKDQPVIRDAYQPLENGFYKCMATDPSVIARLKDAFRSVGFSALHFTDSRSVYQFFGLDHLYEAITDALAKDIHKINLVTPPVSISELYRYLTGEEFFNETKKPPYYYDIRTKYTPSGYITTKEEELAQIGHFIDTKIH